MPFALCGVGRRAPEWADPGRRMGESAARGRQHKIGAQQSDLLELFGSLQQKVAKSLHLSLRAIPHALAVRHDQVEHDDRLDVGARVDFLFRFV
jgi:hypothetical protein